MGNTIMDLKKFFSTQEKPVNNEEIRKWWESLTEEEKQYFKEAKLE